MYVTTHVCLSFPAVQELTQLQDKHATRPDVFDDVEEEQEIEILTQEITQVHVLAAFVTRLLLWYLVTWPTKNVDRSSSQSDAFE